MPMQTQDQVAATASTMPALPAPAERPDADIVIYDGHCRFCTHQVQRLARWDRRQRLAFLSLHDPQVSRRWPQFTHEQLMREMFLVESTGRITSGAMAFRRLSRILPPLWLAAPLLHLPGSMILWRPLYQWVARRRYRIMGRTDHCEPGGTCHLHDDPPRG